MSEERQWADIVASSLIERGRRRYLLEVNAIKTGTSWSATVPKRNAGPVSPEDRSNQLLFLAAIGRLLNLSEPPESASLSLMDVPFIGASSGYDCLSVQLHALAPGTDDRYITRCFGAGVLEAMTRQSMMAEDSGLIALARTVALGTARRDLLSDVESANSWARTHRILLERPRDSRVLDALTKLAYRVLTEIPMDSLRSGSCAYVERVCDDVWSVRLRDIHDAQGTAYFLPALHVEGAVLVRLYEDQICAEVDL